MKAQKITLDGLNLEIIVFMVKIMDVVFLMDIDCSYVILKETLEHGKMLGTKDWHRLLNQGAVPEYLTSHEETAAIDHAEKIKRNRYYKMSPEQIRDMKNHEHLPQETVMHFPQRRAG